MIVENIKSTRRVEKLREYYLKNSPRIFHPGLTENKDHRALLLFLEGWRRSKSTAATTRIRKSMAEAYMLENTVPIIIPDELIVGQPDFREFNEEEQKAYDEYKKAEEYVVKDWGRKDHLALDYQLLLEKGISGILEIIDEEISKIDINDGLQTERYEYFLCCKIELESFNKMCSNYAKEALRLAEKSRGKEKEELMQLYETLCNVPFKPAASFREALQSIHMFTFSLYGLYSFGKPDLYLLPYYRNDIEKGILTPEKAQELVDCFYLLTIPNVPGWAAEGLMLAGRDGDGNKVENELTWHFLKAIEHTHLPDPNVGFCITEETSEEIMEYVSKIIADGHAQPQVWNNDAVVESMIKNGFDEKDANLFTLSTCVEVTPIGCSGINVTSPMINVLEVFMEAFNKCTDDMTFEDVFKTFENEFRSVCDERILQENLYFLEQARNSTDPMRSSVLIHDCIERGLSHDSGGARYNYLEPDLFGVQNVGESLNIIKHLVFEENYISISEFKKALENNYDGYESLLSHIRNKTPHFGTGDEEANNITKRVADIILKIFSSKKTARNSAVLPGNFSYLYHVGEGKKVGASPDGRRAGMPLNDGCNPVQGYDNMGPTLSLASTAFWEPARFLGGTSVNVKINKGTEPKKINALIKGYIKTKCAQLQFNIVDADELIKAQHNPEKYSDLIVRIGGYSEFFVRLQKPMQDEIISRTLNEM